MRFYGDERKHQHAEPIVIARDEASRQSSAALKRRSAPRMVEENSKTPKLVTLPGTITKNLHTGISRVSGCHRLSNSITPSVIRQPVAHTIQFEFA